MLGRDQLEGISRHGDSPAEYAAWIVNGGRTRIFLKEDDPDGTRVVHLFELVMLTTSLDYLRLVIILYIKHGCVGSAIKIPQTGSFCSGLPAMIHGWVVMVAAFVWNG